MKTYPVAEHEHMINGVPGRMFAIHRPQEVRDSSGQTWPLGQWLDGPFKREVFKCAE